MPFEVRIGASKWDRNENIDAYNKLSAVGREFGFSGWLRESTLISLIEHFGADKTEWGLRRLHGKGNYSLDTLVGILEGSIPAVRKAPVTTPDYKRPAPASERSGPRSVSDFLDEHPPKPISGKRPAVNRVQGAMTLPQVHTWLGERNIPISQAESYFMYSGVGVPGNIDLYVLLPTHLLPKERNNGKD